METNNGQEAYDRIAAEFTAEEAERHRRWRELKLSGAALQLGNAIGEAIERIESDE